MAVNAAAAGDGDGDWRVIRAAIQQSLVPMVVLTEGRLEKCKQTPPGAAAAAAGHASGASVSHVPQGSVTGPPYLPSHSQLQGWL